MAKKEKLPCICKGNWRSIIHESEPLFGKRFRYKKGGTYTFAGVMHSEDDYYYVMWSEKKTNFLSCVGNIVGWG